ncbi:3085_t:CDS:2, partial [Gigaspora rosea]
MSNNSINEINETSNNDCEFEETDVIAFDDFLNEIKEDYQNATPQLCTALNKFVESRIKSGSMIRVQVESVKRRKTEGSGRKRKLLATIKNKENYDPQ